MLDASGGIVTTLNLGRDFSKSDKWRKGSFYMVGTFEDARRKEMVACKTRDDPIAMRLIVTTPTAITSDEGCDRSCAGGFAGRRFRS